MSWLCYFIIYWCVVTITQLIPTSSNWWTSSYQSTQHTLVPLHTTFTTVHVPNTERTTLMDEDNRDFSPTTTRDTSFFTHVRSVSDNNTETTPTLVRTTAIDEATSQEAPSLISKEPKHGRLLRDSSSKQVYVKTISVKYKRKGTKMNDVLPVFFINYNYNYNCNKQTFRRKW